MAGVRPSIGADALPVRRVDFVLAVSTVAKNRLLVVRYARVSFPPSRRLQPARTLTTR